MRFGPLALALVLLPALALGAPPELLQALDAQYARRDDPHAERALDEGLRAALREAPGDFELLWRLARLRYWQADGEPGERRKRVLGKEAWDLGDRARQVAPGRVEGHFYAAAGMGMYSQAVGVLKALGEGLEGKFNERLDRALQLAPDFERGAPLLAKGRYHFELPWPKRDLERSQALLEQVAGRFPQNLRAHLYLAETLLQRDRVAQARAAVQRVLAGDGRYDPPEARRVTDRTKRLQAQKGELK